MVTRTRKSKFLRKKPRPRRPTKKFRRFERKVERFTRGLLIELQGMVKQTLVPRIRLLASTHAEKQKAVRPNEGSLPFRRVRFDAPGDGESMEMLIDVIEAQFLGKFSKAYIRANLNTFFQELDLTADTETLRQFALQNIEVGVAANAQAVMENAVRSTTGKITNLSSTTIGNIRSKVSEGVIQGSRWESIAKDLTGTLGPAGKGTFKTAANRAKFIARNEVGNALGAINKERQEAAGVDLYTWQTAEDERVRPTHARLDQKVFSWKGKVTYNGVTYTEAVDPAYSSSPTIPGQPWNCRCVAIPFIPELEEEGL